MTGWSEQDKIAFAKFGRKPKKSVLNLAGKERQHFDSADYEMNKGPGKTPAVRGGNPLGVKKAPIPESVRKQMEGQS
eukprot:CAMPEP_0206202810 /NCGR_PEP_ID=MMETSP0166-20121206/12417_1 /ASSEMBLY_ACC=CAM_ASM_000260 /TAXON_ID=95228 /ORGANISM="Vannella robusta, Strain DIVA3 518/3/11/1/6" /LENGTH=76 /DNA_ID=CAMNT_0053621851 /DNA_START=51 /DNA_END=281 /DNA_ORIENTATION=-